MRVQLTFADGGTAVAVFRRQNPARIGIVLRVRGLLWRAADSVPKIEERAAKKALNNVTVADIQ